MKKITRVALVLYVLAFSLAPFALSVTTHDEPWPASCDTDMDCVEKFGCEDAPAGDYACNTPLEFESELEGCAR